MQLANIAARLLKPFANSGNKAAIPQNGTDPARASYETGFTPLNMTPIAAGGVPPSGQDMNGILYEMSNALMWQQAMGILPYDAAISYPNGALAQYQGKIYRCLADDTAGIAPGSNAAKWTEDIAPNYFASGALELTSVPTQKIAPIICVTQPHFRMMIWNGSQYVRAPWHQPCELFFSYDNPATLPGALPVRADVSYQQSNYPDVVQRLGLSGSGTFSLVESRGEFLRVLDNGRGVDVGRGLRSWQRGSPIAHDDTVGATNFSALDVVALDVSAAGDMDAWTGGLPFGAYTRAAGSANFSFIPANSVVFFGMARPRNIAVPLWMTI